MLYLFRKICQSLLAEGRVTRFVFYAFGEIILISIGLLIALQINIFSEHRKDRKFEYKMLHETRSALKTNRWYYRMLEERLDRLDAAATTLLELYGQEFNDMDTVNQLLSGLYYNIQIYSNNGPYEALKSSGLDKISIDSVRQALVNHYDFWLPRNENMIREEKIQSGRQLEALWDAVFTTYPRMTEDGQWLTPGIELRNAEINKDERYRLLLINRKSYAVAIKNKLENLYEPTDQLIAMLDAVLNNGDH